VQNRLQEIAVRRAFGLFFIAISIAVGLGSLLNELVFVTSSPAYLYPIVWLVSFSVIFGGTFRRFRGLVPLLRSRMKKSISWPSKAKALNGICWASPFAAIGIYPALYQYLILLGIGLGNLSTYLLMKKYNGVNNTEQMIVGLVSIAAIPVAAGLDTTVFVARHDIVVAFSRILISLAYGMGGVYALLVKQ
jgi:hypothetical protein